MNKPTPILPQPITDERMACFIQRLRPDRELYSGRKFFEKLLQRRGVDGVLAFIDKASIALDKQDGLDLHFDFDRTELELFKQARMNLTRRNVLGVLGWGLPGAYSVIYGGLGVAEQAARVAGYDAGAVRPKEKNVFENVRSVVLHSAGPSAELIIGAALLNEAFEKRIEIKLEQIADAIEELQNQLPGRPTEQSR